MSKMNWIDKRIYQSFSIYFVIAIWLIYGCSTKSPVEVNAPAGADTKSSVEDVNNISSQTETVVKEADSTRDQSSDSVALQKDEEEIDYTESAPRIFFKPSSSTVGQILGIDFSMLPQGKSRLTVTTNKKVTYELDRVDINRLSLQIHDSEISNELLLKYIDTTEHQTALEKIKPIFDKENNKVKLDITMREVVPFHINQSDDNIVIDFEKISSKIAEKKIIPLNLVEAEMKNLSAVAEPKTGQQAEIQAFSPSVDKKFKGEPLGLVFDNADVTHILKLINEVSKENIIWDPEIKGKKVSMILNDVPWDEALELILKNNELSKRYVGQNIVWITTKQKMAQILAEEEAEAMKMEQKLEQERQKLVDQAKRQEDDSPLVTEYLPVDFAKADIIKEHVIVSKRGNVRIDTRTNTIIITDTAASIEEAKKIVKQFDTPVKQIMIEARIVEATDDFTRDLGVKWNGGTEVNRTIEDEHPITGGPVLVVEGTGTIADRSDLTNGNTYGGTFSTNSPAANWGNLGLNFARITSSNMGFFALDATLALAESTGKAKTISAPKVIAQEGSEAKISSGEIIKIAATENVSSEDFPAELSLSVTPSSVSFNDYITLNVDVSDDQRVADNRKTTKTISTTLMVKSGETIVIGGIIKEKENESIEGVPVLKDIPGLGWLFKAKRKQLNKTELLIFLTPNVIPSPVKNF